MRAIAMVLALGLLWVAGCVDARYDWGGYENSIIRMYDKPESVDDKHRRALAAEVDKAVERHKQVPPGKAAHVGYLHYLAGDTATAAKYFRMEKELFPESTALMDRMLERM